MLIHFQTSTVARLQFGNGELISCATLSSVWVSLLRLKWQYAILAHSQNSQRPATFANIYLQISLMVTDIQNISHFWWILQILHFPLLVLCQSPCLAGLLTSGSKTCGHITESNYPQTTSNVLGDVILRLGLNWCDDGTICLQFGKMCPYLTMLM